MHVPELLPQDLTLNVDNACRHSFFMGIIHTSKAGAPQFSPIRASPGGVYLSCFLPMSILETISQPIVERGKPGYFGLQRFVTSIPRLPATLPSHYRSQA